MQILPVLIIALISILAIVAVSIGLKNKSENRIKDFAEIDSKDREVILKYANRRLSSNPKDMEALGILADMYYREGEYNKAMHTYKVLLTQTGVNADLDTGELNMKYGISAMRCEHWNEAYKSLMIAQKLKPASIEIMANLGELEFIRKNYEKSIVFLKAVLKVKPDHMISHRFLGLCLFQLKQYKNAIHYLTQSIVEYPDDKEILFALARCNYAENHYKLAQESFRRILNDPNLGPNAALYSGSIFAKKREWEEAASTFRIGLRHEKISKELILELKYRLATAYNQTKRIDKALSTLNEVYDIDPAYKDIKLQIRRYRELNSSKNFQTYLLASTQEFISLCRKLAQVSFPEARVKVTDVKIDKSDYIDLLAEVSAANWEETILFRFIRTEGQVGELFIRDLYSHSKEILADRSLCFSAGSYTGEAVKFVDLRLIDLLDKSILLKMLKSIDAKTLMP